MLCIFYQIILKQKTPQTTATDKTQTHFKKPQSQNKDFFIHSKAEITFHQKILIIRHVKGNPSSRRRT